MECLTMDVNLIGNRPSQYKNYTFNSMVKFGDSYLGANNHGLFNLTGSTDNNSLIVAEFAPILTDFGIHNTKGMYYVFVGCETTNDLLLTTIADGKPQREYTLPSKQSGRQSIKKRLGRDQYGRYWTFTLSNPAGQPFKIYSIDIIPRIRNAYHV